MKATEAIHSDARRGPTRRQVLALGLGAFAVAALPLTRRRAQVVRRTVPVMGTFAELAVVHPDEAWAHRALDAAVAELRSVHRSMTRYEDGSDVGRTNLAAGGAPVSVSPGTATVVAQGLHWARASQGRFDPALGRVASVWDFAGATRPPPAGAWGRFAGAGLFRAVEVDDDPGAPWVRLTSPDVALDLGGIAKGYGVDRAVAALREWGITSGLVNAGGDLYALGASPDGDPWRVGIRDPDDPSGILTEIPLSDAAVATSGDYQHYFEYGGVRYHHLLDPATGAPRRTGERSVTVQAATCMAADAGATAIFGLGDGESTRILAAGDSGARVLHRV